MRATRAYLAGFGTAGSLLAGAALVFVLASAVVSFKGWPQLSEPAQPVAVVTVRAPSRTAVQHVARVLAARASAITRSSSTRAPRHLATAATAGTPRLVAARRQPRSATPARHPAAPPTRPPAPSTHPVPAAPTHPAPAPCVTGSCAVSTLGTLLGNTTAAATGGLGHTVSSVGQAVGSLLNGLTTAAGTSLAQASPQLAHVVISTGAALDGAVAGASTGLGDTVSGVGRALGGILSGSGSG